MLSTVQIYNLYQGFIWVVVPFTCVRFNGWVTKVIHLNRSKKQPPIHKYLPRKDRTSVIIACIMTALFAYVLTGYLCRFQHMVCQQQEITLRVFETKTCEVDEIFNLTKFRLTQDWPFIHRHLEDTDPGDSQIFTMRRA